MGMGSNDNKARDEQVAAAERASQRYAEQAQKGIDYAKEQQGTGRADTERYYKEGQNYLDPYINAGKNSLDAYQAGLGFGDQSMVNKLYDQFRNSPGYQSALKEGQQTVERSAAARGRTQSGALIKELARYGQDYADQNYGKFMDRLGNMAGMGANASGAASGNAINTGNSLAGQGQNYSNMIGNWYNGIGQNYADSELAAGRAKAEAEKNRKSIWGGVGAAVGAGAGAYFGGAQGAKGGAAAGGTAGDYFGS